MQYVCFPRWCSVCGRPDASILVFGTAVWAFADLVCRRCARWFRHLCRAAGTRLRQHGYDTRTWRYWLGIDRDDTRLAAAYPDPVRTGLNGTHSTRRKLKP